MFCSKSHNLQCPWDTGYSISIDALHQSRITFSLAAGFEVLFRLAMVKNPTELFLDLFSSDIISPTVPYCQKFKYICSFIVEKVNLD